MNNQLFHDLRDAVKTTRSYAWIHGLEEVKGPWLVYISPTNICNQTCSCCVLCEINYRKKGKMDFDLFKKIVSELPPETRRVYLMKQGEPLLHKHICDFAEHLKSARPDIEIALHSNASLLDSAKAERLAATVDFFTCSMHTIREERYQEIHGGKHSQDQVIQNFQQFLKAVEKSNRSIKLYVDYVRQDKNKDEDNDTVYQTFHQWFPGVKVGIHNAFSYQNALEEYVTRATTEIDEKYLPRCFKPWTALSICYDGNISYCITEPREKVSLGDIRASSLSEIWSGQAFRDFRRRMANNKFSELLEKEIQCIYCTWLWSLSRIHHHQLLTQDALCYKDLIAGVEQSEEYSDPLCQAYLEYLKGDINLCAEKLESACNTGDYETEAEPVKFIADVLSNYKNLWRHQKMWEEACASVGENYHEFNRVEYY